MITFISNKTNKFCQITLRINRYIHKRKVVPVFLPRSDSRLAVMQRVSKLVSNKCIAASKVATPLRELTCRVGSHSVTCHPTEVTFPPLPQPKLVLARLSNPVGMQGRVDLVVLLHAEMAHPPEDGHPLTHPGTNRARRALTSFMRRTPLTTTPRRH